MYKPEDTTFYHMSMEKQQSLKGCWNECFSKSRYEARKREIDDFNRKHVLVAGLFLVCFKNHAHIRTSCCIHLCYGRVNVQSKV